jgi:hypothetical protein
LSGTKTISVTGKPWHASTDDRYLEWGTTYNRGSDTISGGGSTANEACDNTASCVVTTGNLNKGDVIFHRWKDRDSGDAVLVTGPVKMAAVK